MDVGYIDLETDISQRSEFVKEFFDRLDDVVWVLGKFCEHADWLMGRECRISQLMGEVHLASTEVESILKYAEVFDLNMGEMLLLANGCELSQEYKEVRKQLQSILPRLLPYCSNELKDMSKLLMVSEEENEPTKLLNRQLLKMTNDIVKNFVHVLQLLFFHIDNAYQRFEALNDAQIKILFDKQYMQYCNDNAQMLQEYVDDIDDVHEAKSELKELFSMPSLLKCYKRNVGKPHLLIKEMRQSCMFEHHLVEIYAYQAKMEKIKNIKAPAPSPQIVINGDIIEGDKVKEKTVIPNVGNYKPEIRSQTMNMPLPPFEQDEQELLEDE